MRRLSYLFIIILLVSGCRKEDITSCKLVSGSTGIDYRNIPEFKNIAIRDNVNLILHKSDTSYVKVETGENLLEGIKTTVNDRGWLELKNSNGCDWARDYSVQVDVHVFYTDIDTIEYRSIGNITSVDTLKTDSLWIHVMEGAGEIMPTLNVKRLYCQLHSGTADVFIDGYCGLAVAYSAGYGVMDLRDLQCDVVFINSRSSNNSFVNASITLGAQISNIGDIYYKGNPKSLTLTGSGSGKLIKLDE